MVGLYNSNGYNLDRMENHWMWLDKDKTEQQYEKAQEDDELSETKAE